MSVLLDTGIVYAYYDRSDAWHMRARNLIQSEQRGLILPSPVIPEADHLLGQRLGSRARQTFYEGIAEGYFLVADLPRGAYGRVAGVRSPLRRSGPRIRRRGDRRAG